MSHAHVPPVVLALVLDVIRVLVVRRSRAYRAWEAKPKPSSPS